MTGAEQEAIIAQWIVLVNDKVASQRMRENLEGIALLFAELAGCFLVWERALEAMKMGESQVANRWRAQGALAQSRTWLLKLLQTKYPAAISSEVTQLVEQQTDLAILSRWFESAIEAPTFEQFVQTLR